MAFIKSIMLISSAQAFSLHNYNHRSAWFDLGKSRQLSTLKTAATSCQLFFFSFRLSNRFNLSTADTDFFYHTGQCRFMDSCSYLLLICSISIFRTCRPVRTLTSRVLLKWTISDNCVMYSLVPNLQTN